MTPLHFSPSGMKQTSKQPDLISSEGFLNTNLYAYLNKVLEIRPENGTYVIRSMFYTPYNDNKAVFVLAITNHIVKKDEKGEFKIYNWLDYYTRNWPRNTVGLIDYCYYPEFHFNKKKAQEAKKTNGVKHEHHEGGCPGSRMMQFSRGETDNTSLPMYTNNKK